MTLTTPGQRVRHLREKAGLSVRDLAKAAGMSPGTLSDLENDRQASSTFIPALARELGVDAYYLQTGKGAAELAPIAMVAEPTEGYWFIPRYEAFMAAGDGEPLSDGEPDQLAGNAFREDFCRRFGWHPSTHFTARIDGDSMIEAGLRDGWSVVVDTRENARRIVEGQIYAIREQGRGLLCKFLQPMPDGGLKIISANSAHPLFRTPRELSPEEAEHVAVLGRVVHAQGLLSRSF